MTGVEFDFSELHQFTATIADADTTVRRNTRKAVERAAFVGKKVWRAEARRKVNKSLPHYPESIDYDIEGIGAGNTSGEIVAEVGPKLGGQGSLGIVEDSPGDVGATPQRNYIPAEKAIAEDLVRGILIAVGDGTGET